MTVSDSGQLFFKIGEISERLALAPHVLRYWDQCFPQIRPLKTGRGRLYRQKDLEIFSEIKRLCHVEGFTLEGAKRHLAIKSLDSLEIEEVVREPDKLLSEIRQGLLEIRNILKMNTNVRHDLPIDNDD